MPWRAVCWPRCCWLCSRPLASTRAVGDWVEICTSQGMRWEQWTAEAQPSDSDDTDDLLLELDDCGHCTLTAERFAPLLSAPPLFPQADGAWGLPLHHAAGQHALDAPSPGARGPPLLS